MAEEAASASVADAPAGRRAGTGLIWLGLLLALAAPVVYMLLLDNPFQRATGAVMFGMLILAAIVGLLGAQRKRRLWGWIVGALPAALLAFAAVGFTAFAKLPAEQGAIQVGDAPPMFTLADQTGRPVALATAMRGGPQLLVFYRGFW